MDVEHPRFDEYETQFQALAENAENWEAEQKPELNGAQLFLCLYGENGLEPEEEFAALERLNALQQESTLHKLEIEADYYQDTILFVL